MSYDVKTIRVHLPDRGQYVYLMLTKFDGRENMLGEIGYTNEYIHFATMSQNSQMMCSGTDPFALAREHSESGWLRNTIAFDLMYALDTEDVPWDAISDGDQLTPDDIRDLREFEA